MDESMKQAIVDKYLSYKKYKEELKTKLNKRLVEIECCPVLVSSVNKSAFCVPSGEIIALTVDPLPKASIPALIQNAFEKSSLY